mgnify:FL=1
MSDYHHTNKNIPYWYVMRAYKNEAKAEKTLSAKGVDFFIAKIYAVRTVHGKTEKKRCLVPAIPEIVFVHASHTELIQFKKTHNFLQFVTTRNSGMTDYLIVPEKQMNDFIKVAGKYEEKLTYFSPDEIQLEKGTRVRIHGGVFDGVEGTLLKIKGKRSRRIVVAIDNVSAVAISEVTPDLIEVLG